jgi:hypothetical protein
VHINGLIVDSGGITHFLQATTNNVSMDELVHIDYGTSIFIHLFYRLHELPAQILDTPVAPPLTIGASYLIGPDFGVYAVSHPESPPKDKGRLGG